MRHIGLGTSAALLAGVTTHQKIEREVQSQLGYNGRDDRLSPKRHARRMLCKKYGITSGRQWVRLRRRLQREARAK